ncbi:hypothetical protein Syun_006978 [Stephania yunnanensis]|uniref:Uncharacterized protein n=1 Tax=Stephania yunnanensis TaxID=152371 RepID=A0AAP0KZC5_9MAGN
MFESRYDSEKDYNANSSVDYSIKVRVERFINAHTIFVKGTIINEDQSSKTQNISINIYFILSDVNFVYSWKLKNPPLPSGYYGNAFVFPMVVGAPGEVRARGLEYAAEKVRRAKGEVMEEYVRSKADMMVERRRPHFTVARTYGVERDQGGVQGG